jgi:DNA modification methylase
MKPLYKDDLTTIYCADSRKVLPKLEQVDLVLTDPPYGLNTKWKRTFQGVKRSKSIAKADGTILEWDRRCVDLELLGCVLKVGKRHIIWGGNFYDLPPSPCWLVWDKVQAKTGGPFGADCELAWTSLQSPPRIFVLSRIEAYWCKAVFKKIHPTEKPVQLGLWCLKIAKATSIIDPFMGTGNFLVAARMQKIPAIGIEMNEEYCQEAIARITTNRPRQVKKMEGFGI